MGFIVAWQSDGLDAWSIGMDRNNHSRDGGKDHPSHEGMPHVASTAMNPAVPALHGQRVVPLTSEQIATLDEEMVREPEHSDVICSPGWCLVRPGRVSGWGGYHRSQVRTTFVEWGLTIQIGLGQSFEEGQPVVHLRALENDCNGDEPYDVVMSPDEAIAMAAQLRATAARASREIIHWRAAGGAR